MKIYRALLGAAIALLLVHFPLTVAVAHGAEPRLEISADRINAGGTLEVRGVDFVPEEPVILALTAPGLEISLGSIMADVEGGFTYLLVLPPDLKQGSYTVTATAAEHQIVGPTFMVSDAAFANEDEGAQREHEDALLAPMPSSAPVTMAPAPPSTASFPESTSTRSSLAMGLVAVTALGAAAVAAWRLRSRR